MDIIVSMYTRHTTLSRVGHSLVLNLNWSMLFGMHVPGPSGVVLRTESDFQLIDTCVP